MPKRATPLTDLQVRNAKKREKPYKLADGGGLYVEVTPGGAKLWRLKYRQLNGKENKLHFGAYPDVSLSLARERRDAARTLLGAGIDPGQARDADARLARSVSEHTFEKVARDWHGKMIKSWQPQTAENILHRFEVDLFPVFGNIPIADVKVPDVLKAIRLVEERGALEVAKRLLLAIVALIERQSPPDHRIELTQTEIGNAVRMTQPSVSATVASLVHSNFLTKEDAPRGRHKVYGLGEKLLKHVYSGDDDE